MRHAFVSIAIPVLGRVDFHAKQVEVPADAQGAGRGRWVLVKKFSSADKWFKAAFLQSLMKCARREIRTSSRSTSAVSRRLPAR